MLLFLEGLLGPTLNSPLMIILMNVIFLNEKLHIISLMLHKYLNKKFPYQPYSRY